MTRVFYSKSHMDVEEAIRLINYIIKYKLDNDANSIQALLTKHGYRRHNRSTSIATRLVVIFPEEYLVWKTLHAMGVEA